MPNGPPASDRYQTFMVITRCLQVDAFLTHRNGLDQSTISPAKSDLALKLGAATVSRSKEIFWKQMFVQASDSDFNQWAR